VRTSLEELLFALNDHVTKSGDRLEDATFLGTLQLKSHRFLLETCYDEPKPTLEMIKALAELGQAFTAVTRKPRVTDAIRLLSKLREAAMDKPEPSRNLRLALDNWKTEKEDDE
jgi:hypothetical protein